MTATQLARSVMEQGRTMDGHVASPVPRARFSPAHATADGLALRVIPSGFGEEVAGA